ncbi:hypothetical protein ACFL27_05920 [candidate division CSSED10-310 bacterium]|uniref:FeoB-associated Cys-rich membrane protein n=1 Tax=candidate division CSSED10-310 bacterium TaxID=2855610 RepID=A0ABV6YU48_UNCC1
METVIMIIIVLLAFLFIIKKLFFTAADPCKECNQKTCPESDFDDDQ